MGRRNEMGAAWKIVQGCLYTAIVSMLSIAMLPGITCARHIEFLMNEPASTTQMSTTNRASLKYDCLSDNECPIGKYCNFHDGDLLEFGECVPLVKKDGKCTSSYDRHVWIWFDESSGPYEHHNCAKGLYCNRSQKCRRAADIGGNCDAAIYHSCKQGTYCDGKKCKKQGVKGESCNPSSYPHKPCDQSRGLFCKHTEEDAKKGTCEYKLEAGKESQRTGCQGFEIRPVGHENLVCMSGRSEGQFCTKNSQCRGKKRDGSTRMETVCNWIDKKMGRLPRYGVCAKETSLLKKVGLACQTKKDLCDARRDLRCEKRGGKNVCVQNGGFNAYGKSHCTPGSKYSTCPGQTCRQLTKMISQSSYGPFLCLHSVEVLKEGEICSLFEHTHCGKGLKCVKALEVSTMGGSSEPLAYCVRHVMQGKKCNKRTCMPDPCKAGSVCVNGECSSGEMMDNMARCPGHGVSCKMQNPRCAPGLICSGGACLLPTKTVDVGEACGETSPANKVCTKGAICDNWDGNRGGVCEKHDKNNRIAGAPCWDDWKSCGKGLQCSDWLDVGILSTSQKVCYEKKASLKVGQKCNEDEEGDDDRSRSPHAGWPVPTCYVPDKGRRPLKCIHQVCQAEARLFDSCSTKKIIVCEEGLVCSSKMSVCIGKEEAD